jgi:hypothetical protein
MASMLAVDELEVEAHKLAAHARKLADVLDDRARRLAERASRYRQLADSIAEDENADARIDKNPYLVNGDTAGFPAGAVEERRAVFQRRSAGNRRSESSSLPKSVATDREQSPARGAVRRTAGPRGKAPRTEVLRTLAEADHNLSIAEICDSVSQRLPETPYETVRITVYNLKRSGYVDGANARFHIVDKGMTEFRGAA